MKFHLTFGVSWRDNTLQLQPDSPFDIQSPWFLEVDFPAICSVMAVNRAMMYDIEKYELKHLFRADYIASYVKPAVHEALSRWCDTWTDALKRANDAEAALGKNAENSTQEPDGDTSKAPQKKQLDTRG